MDKQPPIDNSASPTLSRRSVFMGAGAIGAVGALAAVASLPDATPQSAETAQPKPEPAGGYQLTEHVKQYYAKARV
jgi:hypothetical protein